MKGKFPGASITRCERGKVDVDLILGVDSFSLDKALEVGGSSSHRPPTPLTFFERIASFWWDTVPIIGDPLRDHRSLKKTP